MVQTLLELYGEGLARIVENVGGLGEQGTQGCPARRRVDHPPPAPARPAPLDVQSRVLGALDEVRPYLESHGGNVQFLGIEDGVARVRLEGSCEGCPSSTMTLKLAIEEAVQKAAPELEGVEAEGVAEPPPKPTTTFVAGPTLSRKKKKQPEENGASSWMAVGGLDLSQRRDAGEGGLRRAGALPEAGGRPLSPTGTCAPAAAGRWSGGAEGGGSQCSGCGRATTRARAGRSLDDARSCTWSPSRCSLARTAR